VIAAQTGVSGSSTIGDRVVVGGQVGIADHCTLESGSVAGAQAGIPTGKTIRGGQTVWGTPAREIGKFKEIYVWYARLPELPSASKSLRQNLAKAEQAHASTYRLIVVGGHTRSIGKTQLVCDLVAALPEANFIAGKITQYGHGVCAQNGEHCGCAPDEHASAFSWEENATSGNGQRSVSGCRSAAGVLAAHKAGIPR